MVIILEQVQKSNSGHMDLSTWSLFLLPPKIILDTVYEKEQAEEQQ